MIRHAWIPSQASPGVSDARGRSQKQAEVLVRGLAHVGIIAMVEEATGYQDAPARDALANSLETSSSPKKLQKVDQDLPSRDRVGVVATGVITANFAQRAGTDQPLRVPSMDVKAKIAE